MAEAEPTRCRIIMPARYLDAALYGKCCVECLRQMCKAAFMGEPGERHGSRLLRWLGIALIVYLVPAIVLLLDGALFSSHLWHALTPGERHIVNVVYWPVEQPVKYIFERINN